MEKRVVTFTSTSYNIGIPNPKQRVLEKVQPFHLSTVRRGLPKIVHLQKGGVEKNLDLVIQAVTFLEFSWPKISSKEKKLEPSHCKDPIPGDSKWPFWSLVGPKYHPKKKNWNQAIVRIPFLVIQSDLFGMVSSRDPFKGWKRDLQRLGDEVWSLFESPGNSIFAIYWIGLDPQRRHGL